MPKSSKSSPKSSRTYVPVVVMSDGAFKCPVVGCFFVHTVYRQVYNHYGLASQRLDPAGHIGLLCRADCCKRNSAQAIPRCPQDLTPDPGDTAAAGVVCAVTHASSSSSTEASADAHHSVSAPEALSALSSVQGHRLHTLPHQCKCSILVHGHVQGIISNEKLHAAASDCYSGTEAWLESSTVHSIKSKAVLSLHPDKNQNLPAAYCNDLFAEFHQRVNDLLYSKDDTLYWTSLVHESVAAVSYLRFCQGQATLHASQENLSQGLSHVPHGSMYIALFAWMAVHCKCEIVWICLYTLLMALCTRAESIEFRGCAFANWG